MKSSGRRIVGLTTDRRSGPVQSRCRHILRNPRDPAGDPDTRRCGRHGWLKEYRRLPRNCQELAAAGDHLMLREEDGFLGMVGERGKIETLDATGQMLLNQFRLLALVVHVSPQPGQGASCGRAWNHRLRLFKGPDTLPINMNAALQTGYASNAAIGLQIGWVTPFGNTGGGRI